MPYRRRPETDHDARLASSNPTKRDDLWLLAALFLLGAGPIASHSIFGAGSGVEMGIGAVVSIIAAAAMYRIFSPIHPVSDEGADGSDQEA